MVTPTQWYCRFFNAADFPKDCAEDRWATEDPTIVTDYLNTRYVEFSDSACDDLPFVTITEPLAVDQDARRFAGIPADYLVPEQRSACPYGGDLPLADDEVDSRHFWNLLTSIIPEVAADIPATEPTPDHVHRILDLACGRLTAASALQSYFGETAYGEQSAAAQYIGVDINANAIAGAQYAHAGQPNVKFVVADATDISAEPWAQTPFDTVVIRHPEVFRRYEKGLSATWYYIFKTSATQLRIGGLLLVTTHQCFEFQGADAALTALGLTRLYAAQHPCSPVIDAGNYILRSGSTPLRDHYVAVYTRTLDPSARSGVHAAQISTEEVFARTAAGTEYRVRYIPGLNQLHYQSVEGQYAIGLPDHKEHQLATDGTDTFFYYVRNRDERIMRLDLESPDVLTDIRHTPSLYDFIYRRRDSGDDWPLEVRVLGFRILGQQLVGDAAVIWSAERVERTIFPLQ